ACAARTAARGGWPSNRRQGYGGLSGARTPPAPARRRPSRPWDQRSEKAMRAKLPMLTGYRVLDITQFVAGPTCTRILAELGADVIKVELAPNGDRGRASGDKPRDAQFKASSQSTYLFQHNHSKKSLAIDIKQARGRALLRAIVPKIDVLVENFAPGVMARAGLGYDELSAIHPGLIMCSISLAGQTGPLSRKLG